VWVNLDQVTRFCLPFNFALPRKRPSATAVLHVVIGQKRLSSTSKSDCDTVRLGLYLQEAGAIAERRLAAILAATSR
jgi:hypothetical protein